RACTEARPAPGSRSFVPASLSAKSRREARPARKDEGERLKDESACVTRHEWPVGTLHRIDQRHHHGQMPGLLPAHSLLIQSYSSVLEARWTLEPDCRRAWVRIWAARRLPALALALR